VARSGNRVTRTLLVMSTATLGEMLRKGNVWYSRHYEVYFDRVCVAFFIGAPRAPVALGNTILVSIGTGRGSKIDLVLAPYSLYRLARRIRATSYATGDLVYSWWTNGLLKALLKAKIHLTPICIPEIIYKNTGRSLSGFLPIWFERVFILLSFKLADKVVMPFRESAGDFFDWIVAYPSVKDKVVAVDAIVDDLPSMDFYQNLQLAPKMQPVSESGTIILVYVGRLSRDKLVDDLVRMMASIKSSGNTPRPMRLDIVGDGPELPRLKRLSEELGVEAMIRFVGTVPNEDLPRRLLASDTFLSPFTGTSLREAALCGLPIVAYDMEWVRGVFKHHETALLVPARDFKGMAEQVIRLANDEQLRRELSRNVKELAWRLWSPQSLKSSLRQAYADDYQ